MSRDPSRVDCEVRIAAPAPRVFRALTESGELTRWLCDEARSDPRAGGELWMRWTGPRASLEPYAGQYIEVAAPRRLSYAGGHSGYPRGDAGRVEIVLEEEGGGTRVRACHEFPTDPAYARFVAVYREAWPRALERLRAWCEDSPAP